MKLLEGRPEDSAGRLEKEIRVYDFLDRLQLSYERIDHAALPGDSEFLFESRFDIGNRSDGDLFI